MQPPRWLTRTLCITIVMAFLLTAWSGGPFFHLLFSLKYAAFAIAGITAITLLSTKRATTPVRIVSLIILFYIFGVAIAIHPSPLCALTKAPVRYYVTGVIPPPMMAMGTAMLLLTIIGNKIFCGWICPLGCAQESVFLLSKRSPKKKCSFAITNGVRTLLLVLFIIVLFVSRRNIYDAFNPFQIFHWHFTPPIIGMAALLVGTSVFFYRPFCQFVCPAGLVTWLFEQVSLFAVRMDDRRCTSCKKCVKASPCNAVAAIIEHRKAIPDCFACGACITACPEDALTFSWK